MKGLNNLNKKYIYPADILLPKDNFDKWAVIACDQFTSEKDYWDKVEAIVGDYPSTLKVTLPEIYLSRPNVNERIKNINLEMKKYLEGDFFHKYENAMIYVERMQSDGKIRHGIVGAIDLRDYDYHKGCNAVMRATEQTVIERLPARVEIRKGATLELPHVLVLIDDHEKTAVEAIAAKKDQMEKIYDFDLMLGGGWVRGYLLTPEMQEEISESLSRLAEKNNGFLYAVGDGNHSLATAKVCYNLKSQKEPDADPYSLVEIMNIHDESLEFEPIYRVVFGVDREKLLSALIEYFGGEYTGEDCHTFDVVTDGEITKTISVTPVSELPVGSLQAFLDNWQDSHLDTVVDYVHGTDSVKELSRDPMAIGFIYNGMTKDQLFTAVAEDGALPRKTFSMGHAKDKRYYIEAREISQTIIQK